MIELIEAPDSVVAFKGVGHVEESGHEQVLKPALEQAVADHGKARIVFLLAPTERR